MSRGAAARVDRHGQAQLLTRCPHRVVDGIVVRRLGRPLTGDHHPAAHARVVGPPDLFQTPLDVVDDRYGHDPGPPHRVGSAQIGQPPVVGPCAGEGQFGVVVARPTEAGPKRRGRDPAETQHVGVGEDHLSGHSFVVELLLP